ncbi:MAG: SCO family protein [Bacteroidota bacterium]
MSRLLCLAAMAVAVAACQPSTPEHLAVEDDLTDSSWTLVDRDSASITFPADLAGRPTIVAAIYTHCPDVCLMTMANMKQVKRALGADTSRVGFATLTFDPNRDTPTVLRAYAETWKTGPDWRLLTGDSTEVAGLMDRLNIRYEISRTDTLASGETIYHISHTDKALLLDSEGRVVETYGGSAGIPDMIAQDARALL